MTRELEPLAGPAPSDASEQYAEPQPLPKVSDHKTLEVDTVKLAPEIDPRKRATELKLGRVRRRPPDAEDTPSVPPEGVVSPTATAANGNVNRALVGLVVLLLLCAGAFALARGLRSRVAPGPVASAGAAARAPVAVSPAPPTPVATHPAAALNAAAAKLAAATSAAATPPAQPAPNDKPTAAPAPAAKPAARSDRPRPAPPNDAKTKHSIY